MARAHPPALSARSALLLAVAVGAAGGCASVSPPAGPAQTVVPGAPAPASAVPPVDPGSDWRSLPPAPFGSRLQDLRLPLHEVLLFDGDDAEPGAADAARQRECYAVAGPPRRFVGRDTDGTLLCFRSGRLRSVEVSLKLPAGEAAQRLGAYCDIWLQAAAGNAVRTAQGCSGADPGGAAFEADLGEAEGDIVPLLIVVNAINSPESP